MRNRIWTAVFASTLFVSQACYHTRVLTEAPPASAVYTTKTVHQLFWGLVQQNVEVKPGDCTSNALQEVRVTTNFGYSLLTVATLGIWSPLDVEYKCAKEPPPAPPHFGARTKTEPKPKPAETVTSPPAQTETTGTPATGTRAPELTQSTESQPKKPHRRMKE
jgi:hypothetical protein